MSERVKNQRLINDFFRLDGDKLRWKWVIDHQRDGVIVMLDNDQTFIRIGDIMNDDNCFHADFSESIGNMPGTSYLLEAIGIKGECV